MEDALQTNTVFVMGADGQNRGISGGSGVDSGRFIHRRQPFDTQPSDGVEPWALRRRLPLPLLVPGRG
jgi:hypothetical protein